MFENYKAKKALKKLINTTKDLHVYIHSASCNHYVILFKDSGMHRLGENLNFKSLQDAKEFLKSAGLKVAFLSQHTTYDEASNPLNTTDPFADAIPLQL